MTSIGFHVGPGGNMNGIGDHFRQLDAAGIPFFLKSADNYGPCFEAANLAKTGNIPHTIIFRLTTAGQGDGYDYDVPPYQFPPVEAAAIHWSRTLAALPPEFDKEQAWIEPINEVDKGRADWLGNFAAEIGQLAMNQGYKVTLFGWSSGEPEPADWQLPGMRRYLAMCAANPGKLAVSLHEYSYSQDIRNQHPYLIGRFIELFKACAAMGLARPTVHITEWGWELNNVPEPTQALLDIDWAYRLYAPYPEVKGVAIWYLGGGWDGIAGKAQKLIAPVTQFMLNAPVVDPIPPIVPPPAPPPPPPAGTLQQRLWAASVAEQIARGIPLNPNAGLQQAIFAADLTPVHREVSVPAEAGMVIQAGEDVTGQKPRRVFVYEPGKPITSFTDPNTAPIDPPAVFALSSPVKGIPLYVTDWFNTPRDYAGNHEGIDLRATNAAGQPVSIVAAAAGMVDGIRPTDPGTGYGIYVRLRHERPGVVWKTWYCHLSQVAAGLQVGQAVAAGQVLGTAGSTGNSTGIHLHLTVQKIPGGLTGYVIDSVVDPAPLLGLTPPTPPPAPGKIDLVPYFSPADGRGDIAILRNNWGQGEERQQLQREGNFLFVVKNSQYEKRVLRPSTIDLVLDTSPGNGQYYTVSGTWLPREMAVGQSFTRVETVQFFNKADCSPAGNSYSSTSDIKLVARHNNTFTPVGGIPVQDVIELHWLIGGRVEEIYFYGRHLGLVAWQNAAGRRSWIVERIPQGQQEDNEREEISCL